VSYFEPAVKIERLARGEATERCVQQTHVATCSQEQLRPPNEEEWNQMMELVKVMKEIGIPDNVLRARNNHHPTSFSYRWKRGVRSRPIRWLQLTAQLGYRQRTSFWPELR
jgi:hypothetical protein